MKRVIVGSVFSLISSQWLIVFTYIAYINPVPSWGRYGRFVSTLQENGTMAPFVLFSILLVLNFSVLVCEFFHKETPQ